MKWAVFLSSLVFVIGINAAVYIHHEFIAKEIDKRKEIKLELMALEKEPAPVITPYTFHYVGKEKFSNVFSMYRLNKETGELVRYAYTYFDERDDGTPAHAELSSINMDTGAEKSKVPTIDEFLLDLYYRRKVEEEKNKNVENLE